MFKSTKKWLNIPIQIKPFLQYDGAGDKSYDVAVDTKCYREGKTVVVRDVAGNEIVSQKQLYIDGSVVIKTTDLIVLDGKDTTIQAIGAFYDGNTNGTVPDIWVVYL
jgi:hypothetical protein